MSVKGRLQRLENAERERVVLRQAERIAEKHGLNLDDLLRGARDMGERIERWGLDAEIRRAAEEHGLSEDELRAEYEALRVEMEA